MAKASDLSGTLACKAQTSVLIVRRPEVVKVARDASAAGGFWSVFGNQQS
jgi:hypothetical protein